MREMNARVWTCRENLVSSSNNIAKVESRKAESPPNETLVLELVLELFV